MPLWRRLKGIFEHKILNQAVRLGLGAPDNNVHAQVNACPHPDEAHRVIDNLPKTGGYFGMISLELINFFFTGLNAEAQGLHAIPLAHTGTDRRSVPD